MPATLEEATFAPGLQDIKIGGDDTIYSAVERIFITVNGYVNGDVNPEGREDGPGETVHPSRQVRRRPDCTTMGGVELQEVALLIPQQSTRQHAVLRHVYGDVDVVAAACSC